MATIAEFTSGFSLVSKSWPVNSWRIVDFPTFDRPQKATSVFRSGVHRTCRFIAASVKIPAGSGSNRGVFAGPLRRTDVRLVQVTIPAGERETILDELDDANIDYVLSEETSNREFTGIVYFPLPTTAVEPVLDMLREAGVDEDAYTVVLNAETVVSRRFEQLEERYATDDDNEKRIAREEIHARAVDLAPNFMPFLVMTVVSALVATAGLLLNDAAVIVGSMVIAPLIGPAMATSVGTVVDDREMFRQGVKLQALGLVAAVVAATLFAGFARVTNIVPPGTDVATIQQVSIRTAPGLLALVVALGAGVAGGVSLATGVSAALVGVMIAAALVPPLGVIGIGIAWGLPNPVLSATVIVLVNTLSINLSALIVLWYMGYRPDHWYEEDAARATTRKRICALVAVILVLSVFLGVVTYDSYRSAAFEQQVRGEVGSLLDQQRYDDLVLIGTEFSYDGSIPPHQPTRVTVTLARPTGSEDPNFAEPLQRHIVGNVNSIDLPVDWPADIGPVEVRVRYVESERA